MRPQFPFQFRTSLLVLTSILLTLIALPPGAAAFDVTLIWRANDEPDLAGYRVYLRQEDEAFDYDRPEWEGPEAECVIQDLHEDIHYYFVVRAFDTAGNESGDSVEIGVPVLLLSPPDGSHVSEAPTLEWTPGSYDVYKLRTLCYYSGVGYYRADFWLVEDVLVMPASWWDLIEPGHACYWSVLGVDSTKGLWQSPEYGTFTKIE